MLVNQSVTYVGELDQVTATAFTEKKRFLMQRKTLFQIPSLATLGGIAAKG